MTSSVSPQAVYGMGGLYGCSEGLVGELWEDDGGFVGGGLAVRVGVDGE